MQNTNKLTNLKILINIILLISCSLSYAANQRTITVNNSCEFDVLLGINSTPITENNQLIKCEPKEISCYNNQGICANNGICYYPPPSISSNNLDIQNFYFNKKTSKSLSIDLINIKYTTTNGEDIETNKYILDLRPQYQCNYNDGLYSCISGTCERDLLKPMNGQCSPRIDNNSPYTRAYLELNDSDNDYYNIDISNGINIPVSITPVGDFGKQNKKPQLFCKPTGELPSSNSESMNGCTWEFTPPDSGKNKQHMFIQINRDLDSDLTTLCQYSSECPENQLCGLKYPEDIQTYSHSGYCGDPVGYYTVANICSLDNTNSELQKIFNCHRTIDIKHINKDYSVMDKCPESFFEIGLNNILNTNQKFCNYDLHMCNTNILEIGGVEYNYLSSCYDTYSGETEAGACCGCIDWPGVPTDDNNLCLNITGLEEPAPCNINFSENPPDCKPRYDTKIHDPNLMWQTLVKPYLSWLIKGCPDAKEYKFGTKHSVLQCSNNENPKAPDNNINYIIEFCPNGSDIFSKKEVDTTTVDTIKDTNIATDISNKEQKKFNNPSKYKRDINMSSVIIFILLIISVIGLMLFYIDKRDL